MRKAAVIVSALCLLAFSALPGLAEVALDKPAPDFSLADADGKMVKLSDYRGKKVVVVYFYPKDDMGVCKAEACSFRDKYEELKSAGAEVIGISSDSVKSQKICRAS
jgi:peroxiredoxin Q/BCP